MKYKILQLDKEKERASAPSNLISKFLLLGYIPFDNDSFCVDSQEA